jgi:RimJ/RimL family protein N-acetyltransferase
MPPASALAEMRKPYLVGPRIYLRPLEESDIGEAYISWLNDSEVSRYLGGSTGRFPATAESLKRYLERFRGSTTDVAFAIVEKSTGQHIGNVALNHIDWIHGTADTGLIIGRKDYWRKGYATEAWGLVLEYAFRRLGVRKLIAGAVVDNAGSIAALKKLGFMVEGTLRQECLIDGAYRDALRFGLLREEYMAGGANA